MEPYDWAHTNTSKLTKIVMDSIFEVTYLGSAFVQSYKDLYMHLLASFWLVYGNEKIWKENTGSSFE